VTFTPGGAIAGGVEPDEVGPLIIVTTFFDEPTTDGAGFDRPSPVAGFFDEPTPT
jgi:hypothetical protein